MRTAKLPILPADCNRLVDRLKGMPTLDQVISTPLAARLFYLKNRAGLCCEVLTLGDLVYDVVEDRLGGWGGRDTKQKTTEFFRRNTFLIRSLGRRYWRQLVLELGAREQWNVAKSQTLWFRMRQPLGASVKLARRSSRLYAKSGSSWLTIVCQFPVKAASPDASRYRHRATLGARQSPKPTSSRRSMAGGGLRGDCGATPISSLRSWPSSSAICNLLPSQENFVPAAAHVVSESTSPIRCTLCNGSTDSEGAKIVFFEDAWHESARTIATALKISGSAGFDWFYERYLNPKYPFVQAGSALTGRSSGNGSGFPLAMRPRTRKKRFGNL